MMTSLSNRLGFIALRLLRWVVLAMGVERGSAVMGWFWRTIAPRTKRHPRARSQLHAAMPQLSPAEREIILRDMWDGLGQTFAEGLVLDIIGDNPEWITFDNPEVVADNDATNGESDKPMGMLLVSMHSGNWEAFGLGVVNLGLEAAAMYQSVANPLVDADLQAQRARYWKAGLITKGSSAIKRTIGLLRSGRSIGILADHRVAASEVAVPFFGYPAPSTTLPASLALKTGAKLVLGRCKRVGCVRYAIEMVELPVERTGDHASDVVRVTAAIHAQFETWIAERPHEWMWAHRRWSREVLKAPQAEQA